MQSYQKYKSSGIDWIGEIPSHWQVQPLRRITQEHRQGYYISGEYINEGVKLIRITDLQVDGTIKYDEMPFVSISEKDEKIFQVMNGDFLFPRTGSIGLLGVVNNPERAVFASYLINFRFQKKVKSNFLKYYFSSQCFKIGIETDLHGGVNKNIHAENIKNQVIAIPPLEEQTAIANYLDEKTRKIDKLIANKQKLIELLKEERAAIINEAVSGKGKNWGRKKLKYLMEIYGRIGFRGYTTEDIVKQGEGAVSLSPSNIKINEFVLEQKTYITWEKYYESPEIQIFADDIIFVKTGSTIGKIAVVPDCEEKLTLNPQMVVFKNLKINNLFLYYFFHSPEVKGQLDIGMIGGAAQTISQEKINSIEIFVPSLSEQTAIVQRIQTETQRIDNIISKIEKEIKLMNEYRTALISEVVTGKIKVI